MVPFIALHSLFIGSRQVLARGLDDVTDLPDRDDILMDEEEEAILKVIGDDRDRHLLEVLTAYFTAHAKDSGTVAVIYGAAHMPAI